MVFEAVLVGTAFPEVREGVQRECVRTTEELDEDAADIVALPVPMSSVDSCIGGPPATGSE